MENGIHCHSLQYLTEVWEEFSCHYLIPDSPPTALLDRVCRDCFSVTHQAWSHYLSRELRLTLTFSAGITLWRWKWGTSVSMRKLKKVNQWVVSLALLVDYVITACECTMGKGITRVLLLSSLLSVFVCLLAQKNTSLSPDPLNIFKLCKTVLSVLLFTRYTLQMLKTVCFEIVSQVCLLTIPCHVLMYNIRWPDSTWMIILVALLWQRCQKCSQWWKALI